MATTVLHLVLRFLRNADTFQTHSLIYPIAGLLGNRMRVRSCILQTPAESCELEHREMRLECFPMELPGTSGQN